MFDLFHEIAQTMRNNKLRTALTGFAVAWGIFMLIVLLGLSRGLQNGFAENVAKSDQNVIYAWNGVTSKPYQGMPKGRRIQLKSSTVDRLNATDNPFIIKATTYKRIDSAKVVGPVDYVADGVKGGYPEVLRDDRLTLTHGRFLNQADLSAKRKVMVISEKTAKNIFGTDSVSTVIGKRVKSLDLSWVIVGLYTQEWNDRNNYIPFTTAVALSGGETNVWEVTAFAKNVNDLETAEQAATAFRQELAKIHKFDPNDRAAVGIWNKFANFLRNNDANVILDYAVWAIGILTLLTGIVGVSNIMFVSVRERTHEIGIRRAIGAKRRNILTQVILESVSLTTLFGYCGVVLGMLVMQAVDEFILKGLEHNPLVNPTVDLSIAIEVTVVLIIAGALAGFFPALNATKVKPVEALRDE